MPLRRPGIRLVAGVIGAALLGLAVLAVALPAWAALGRVAELFAAGRYGEARTALTEMGGAGRAAEEVLWRSRLSSRPAEALALLQPALADDKVPQPTRIRLALEVAELQAGRGNHRAAVDALTPMLSRDPAGLPGAVHLRAGLSLRALGLLQQAREMLASVRPQDPEFALARYYLGDISLEQKEIPLAQRYFDAATKASTKASTKAGGSRVAAGQWRALMATGEEEKAAGILAQLVANDGGSLALLEIRRYEQVRSDVQQARRTGPAAVPGGATPAPVLSDGYALQFGAFSDRGLALDLQKRYRGQIADLRIDRVRDDRGQFLYKVRAGHYDTASAAKAAAEQAAQRLAIHVIVAELAEAADAAGN